MSAQKPPNKEQNPRSQGLDDADYYIKHVKEAFEVLQREATRLRQEQESIDAMSKKLEHVHFSSTVNLNVGGHCFKTSVQTLTKDPNTMLAAMFSGKFEMKPCEDGAFFIDRDGTHFRFILNYLRTGKLTLPEGATFVKELLEEAEFYQIQGIIDELKVSEPTVQARELAKPFEESEILTNENHRSVLKGWLSSQEGKWRLLFRASRDGFAGATFHSKCDNKGPTVTIVKSGNNIFGSFTEVSWTSPTSGTECITCREAFLYSMVNPRGVRPTKMPLRREEAGQYAMRCFWSSGPSFGNGADIYISDNANTNTASYSWLGTTYESPPGQQPDIFFTGARYFTVTDYEVFGLEE